MARRVKCPYSQRECATCPASIPGKATLFYLVSRVQEKYEALRSADNDGEIRKLKGIIDAVYLPRMTEMLTVLKQQGYDIGTFKKALKQIIGGDEQDASS